MDSTILTALISAGATLAVCLINNSFQLRKSREQHLNELEAIRNNHEKEIAEFQHKQHEALEIIQYQIKELTREVREHNNFARRMPVVEEQIKVINHRIEDLEKKEE